ncbi:MAG: hypothetical protein M3Z86_03755, partial [Lactobacillus panisapium]|nr:hypothetical protein [Lactobacillus panisapium]
FTTCPFNKEKTSFLSEKANITFWLQFQKAGFLSIKKTKTTVVVFVLYYSAGQYISKILKISLFNHA